MHVMKNTTNFEVIIIGGSYAGLSAAMALGRSLRGVLIIDGGNRCNRQTPHAHNFLTQDGEQPGSIAEKGKAEVLKYSTVKWIDDLAISGEKLQNGFSITTQSGKVISAKKLLFASGIKDIMPDIKGFGACWGISIVHCPYCHGYELRDQPTAILANGARAVHLATLVNNLTRDLTLLTTGPADFTPEEITKFNQHKINITEDKVAEIIHKDGQLEKIYFKDGTERNFRALYAAVPFLQHTELPQSLGCNLTESGLLEINGTQETSVPGIYACGDNSNVLRSIANAVYSGNFAGAVLNKVLTDEQF
jgi:thioredoxin reductase